ncbi:glycosyltransferase family 4 protein [Fusobacterium perfoetens]|uniref:glycosyltransferase family 4 protein n=1 Tax=Fusobacterium perfoetens TaxID=852 RepID=UPI001F379534|nr:glycosyltransferase family 4 protein [Fusobacterium perfoetens]MCF2613238.1 glycosyltransferase family 4 protein [Fusobacterium perfoetens]
MKNIGFFKIDITTISGGERVATNLLNELIKRDQTNKYYYISLNKTNKKPFFKLDNKIFIKYLNKNNIRMRYYFFVATFKLVKFLKKEKISILIGIGMGTPLISSICKFFIKDLKIISCEHSNLNNEINNDKFQKLNQYMASKFSDKIITLTKKDKINYIKKFNMSENKIDFIYNFIDDSLLNLKNEYNINSKKIITVGRFDKVKGYDRLVKIAEKVLEKNKDWEWNIYGDGDEFENIKSLIKENNLENQLILKGKSDNIYEIYKEYSFYVMTSYYEGLPMVLLEAKANSLPLISFDIETGPSEIIRHNIDGYLIENGNLNQMIEKINYLIENQNIRKNFSSKSKENLEKFEKNKIISQWISIIQKLGDKNEK